MVSIKEASKPRSTAARDALWNLCSAALPALFAVVALAPLARVLGTERLGLFLLVLAMLGYLGFLDFGLGRALTWLVAKRNSPGGAAANGLVAGVLWLLTAVGGLGAILFALVAPTLVRRVFAFPPSLDVEMSQALWLMAIGLPATLLLSGLRGVLEGCQRFAQLGAIRIVTSFLMWGAMVAAALVWHNIAVLSAVILGARLFEAAMLWHLARATGVMAVGSGAPKDLRSLVGFGGWITISSVVGPVIVYCDRFLIGAMLSATAVAQYGAPFEAATKLAIIPAALVSALFPRLSSGATWEDGRTARLVRQAIVVLCWLMLPLGVALIALSESLLRVWLGADFGGGSAVVFRWLVVGVVLNALSQVPYAALQAAGRPDITAKLHLIEVGPYLLVLAWVLPHYGIMGAAWVWTARVAVDGFALFVLARQSPVLFEPRLARVAGWGLFVAAAYLLAGMLSETGAAIPAGLGWALLLSIILWRILLREQDRAAVKGLLRMVGIHAAVGRVRP